MAEKTTVRILSKTFKVLFLTLGVVFFIMMVLALTPAPFYMHYALGNDLEKSADAPAFTPDHVVMFGGAAMPSESNLIRLFYTAQFATHFEIPVVIAHPKDSICQAEMRRLLRQEGVADSAIYFMTQGTNTRSQVLELKKDLPSLINAHLLIVTSPENMRRTLKCLRKEGFQHLKGIAAREATVNFDLSIRKQDLKGNKAIPSVESAKMRYNFWNYLKLEIICFREYAALAYYKVKGWI